MRRYLITIHIIIINYDTYNLLILEFFYVYIYIYTSLITYCY